LLFVTKHFLLAYSASGNVTGPVVYVNYGRLEDFASLSKASVALNGSIALVRHGAIPASIKVQHAESFGCIGVLIYTDPASAIKGKNKFGPNHVHRDTVQYGFMFPGDPFTPGEAVVNATRNATRISNNLPKIPSLPIAWSHALPLLRTTQGLGVVVDPSWIGGFTDVSYYTGPSLALVNMVNLNEFEIKPVWNVIAHIQGNEEKEKAIILGNHRDAWDNGSVDPSSGASVMVTIAFFYLCFFF
jgi:N-acetylated-alpha-linked acidic dipeptidase